MTSPTREPPREELQAALAATADMTAHPLTDRAESILRLALEALDQRARTCGNCQHGPSGDGHFSTDDGVNDYFFCTKLYAELPIHPAGCEPLRCSAHQPKEAQP